MVVTIILPFSRPEYLNKIFHCLERLDVGRAEVNLITITDGSNELFVDVRNRTEDSKFSNRLAVQFTDKSPIKQYDLLNRRRRIANIHNELKQYIGKTDYIMGLEDDTLFPADTLKRLLNDLNFNPYAGVIQGTELGRHGLLHIGAWEVDDVYEPTAIASLDGSKESHGTVEVDTGGMFCFLTKAKNYLEHNFKTFGNNDFGPDFDWTLALRQQGFKNYNNFDIRCTHKSPGGDLSINTNQPVKIKFVKNNQGRWRQLHV